MSTRKKPRKTKRAVPKFRHRRVIVREANGPRLMSAIDRRIELGRMGPTVAAIEWLECHADGFDRIALLIDAADHMNVRRGIDPDAANHVAVSLTMLRDELSGLRKRLWP